ncbi:MAG: hypothetical protein R2867_09975 [Caldilineaceae bacterium]
MKPSFDLIEKDFNTCFAPLCVIGHALWEQNNLALLREFDAIGMKTREHTEGEKLMDAILVILAGLPSLSLLNTKLRPDPMLAASWHRQTFADQSMVSRTLDAFTPETLAVLQAASYSYWLEHTQLSTHDWRKTLMLDLDLTPLLASRNAEESTKGYLGKKTPPDGKSHG